MKLSSTSLLFASACVLAALSGTEAKPIGKNGMTLEEKQVKCEDLAVLADGVICDFDKFCSTLCKYDDDEVDDAGDDDDAEEDFRRLRATPNGEDEKPKTGKKSPARGLCRCCNVEEAPESPST